MDRDCIDSAFLGQNVDVGVVARMAGATAVLSVTSPRGVLPSEQSHQYIYILCLHDAKKCDTRRYSGGKWEWLHVHVQSKVGSRMTRNNK